jgi:sterol desaturase/sphingolipid hydroxylase (fatty acid hydroxylase superfamily)
VTVELPYLLRFASYFGLFLVFLGCERLAPFAESEQSKPRRVFFHLGLSLGNSALLYPFLAWAVYAALAYTREHNLGLTYWLGLSGGWELLATVVFFDCWDYWMHLANHKIGFLWRFHKAHHSDMEVDVTTASRFHIGELLISGLVKCLMILLWGPSLAGLALFEALLTGASQFHHSNLNIPLTLQDWIEKVVVTPRMHRCHHALHRSCFNTNFSTILSIWDRMAWTYHWSRQSKELVPIGLFHPRGPETMQLKPFLLTPVKGP